VIEPDKRTEEDLGVAAGVSDIGRRHQRNEDAMAVRCVVDGSGRPVLIGVVCDGVSTTVRPEDASRAAADTAADTLADAARSGTDHGVATRAAILAAATAVAGLAPPGGPADAPSCTYVSAMVADGTVTTGWVGDSRAYWLAREGAAALTEDDSWAAEMVARGALTPAEAAANPLGHALTAWLGADASKVSARITSFTPGGPGAVLVCTDGLWNYVPDAAALTALALPDAIDDPLRAASRLVEFALEAGGHDNTTAVLLPYPPRFVDARRR